MRRRYQKEDGESEPLWYPAEISRHRRQRHSHPGMPPYHRHEHVDRRTPGLRTSHGLAGQPPARQPCPARQDGPPINPPETVLFKLDRVHAIHDVRLTARGQCCFDLEAEWGC